MDELIERVKSVVPFCADSLVLSERLVGVQSVYWPPSDSFLNIADNSVVLWKCKRQEGDPCFGHLKGHVKWCFVEHRNEEWKGSVYWSFCVRNLWSFCVSEAWKQKHEEYAKSCTVSRISFGAQIKRSKGSGGPHQNARGVVIKHLSNTSGVRMCSTEESLGRISVFNARDDREIRNCCVEDPCTDAILRANPPSGNVLSLHDVAPEVVESGVMTSAIAFGRNTDGSCRLLFWKASKVVADQITKDDWCTFRSAVVRALNAKPDVARGDQCLGKCKRYVCFGHRKDPLGSGVGQYCFRSDTSESEIQWINHAIGEMVTKLEAATRLCLDESCDGESFQELQNVFCLPSIAKGTLSTQFSVGVEYWSRSHSDDDFFYTTLSCLSDDPDDCDEVLYYFVFPKWGVAVPLRSGDIIAFNPREEHCCTNPSLANSLIFSAYVSAKTVCSHISSRR